MSFGKKMDPLNIFCGTCIIILSVNIGSGLVLWGPTHQTQTPIFSNEANDSRNIFFSLAHGRGRQIVLTMMYGVGEIMICLLLFFIFYLLSRLVHLTNRSIHVLCKLQPSSLFENNNSSWSFRYSTLREY